MGSCLGEYTSTYIRSPSDIQGNAPPHLWTVFDGPTSPLFYETDKITYSNQPSSTDLVLE
jgi:hypothetical protein